MSHLRLFLAHSFATDPRNAQHEPDPRGISDLEIARRVEEWIQARSRGRIEVVRTQDPLKDYISDAVKADISSSDAVLCLFTCRAYDQGAGAWISSTYVISEAAGAWMQCATNEESHRRLFGLVENGVHRQQLGMAFHQNKAAPEFRRDRLDDLEAKVHRIVDQILGSKLPPRDDREYLSLDKTVSIWRNGSVLVECRHRFRFTAELDTIIHPHVMWRISRRLPELENLLARGGKPRTGYLCCVPLSCGRHDGDKCRCEILPPEHPNREPAERNFRVKFSGLHIRPGEELVYDVAWAYENAFDSPSELPRETPNSVGLRTGDRGSVNSVSLTLRFERERNGEPFRVLEQAPQVFTVDSPHFPAGESRSEYWHKSHSWKTDETLRACSRRSSALAEVYRWTRGPFCGMAKVVFHPHLNYFQRDPGSATKTDDVSHVFEI